MNSIKGFFDEHRFLSNFYPAEVEYEGDLYPSVEHAYQAAKTLDDSEREQIRSNSSPGHAKRLGKKVKMRRDWESVKVGIMRDLVYQKFRRHPHLRDMLLATGEAYLEETNTWGDRFWGVCGGIGVNRLGKILMEIRSFYRQMECAS